jgi:peptidoglycan hydrolase-like protein with peptidoglycan-binding domain
MSRKYTGWDGNASGKRAGTERFIKLLSEHFNNGVWNNGSWGVRKMNNPRVVAWSVHGTGRAFDISWRSHRGRGFGNYEQAKQVVDFLVQHAELLLIEEIHDYYPRPHGRGWRCDRSAWKEYTKPTIGNTPGGDWFHVEIAPAHADDAEYYEKAFASIRGGSPAPIASPNPAPAKVSQPSVSKMVDGHGLAYPGESVNRGDRGEYVRMVQEKVGAKVDGDFGPKTEDAVEAWQKANGLHADGIVGPKTWRVMFGDTNEYPGHLVGLKHEHENEVKLIQAKVGAKVDGDYGPKTQQSVKNWQKSHGLEFLSDGIVGEKTWKAMFG